VLAFAWSKPDPYGSEFARVRLHANGMQASGVAIGAEPFPYHLHYDLSTMSDFSTRRLMVQVYGSDWSRSIDLTRDPEGWTCRVEADGAPDLPAPGGDMSVLGGALDCDLALSPLTNTMPVLRQGLLDAGSMDCVMAWVAVPDLTVHRSEQRYTFVRRAGTGAVVRFESGTFAADIEFDADGFVVHYPDLARRLGGPEPGPS
jgi:uncharacterized protein